MQYGIGKKDEVKGGSFSDIGRYLDKQNNAPNMKFINLGDCSSLDEACRLMHETHRNAAILKKAAGISNRGRPPKANPEFHFWLSWHPEEHLTWDEILTVTMDCLADLGLETQTGVYGHQIAIVQHTDKPHQHVHVLINRVNSRNGRRWNRKNEHAKLQRCCDRYERARGQNYIPERRLNLDKNKAWGEQQDNLRKTFNDQGTGGTTGSDGKKAPLPARERQTDRIWSKPNRQLFAEKAACTKLGQVAPNDREIAQKDVLAGKVNKELYGLNTLFDAEIAVTREKIANLQRQLPHEMRELQQRITANRYSGVVGWMTQSLEKTYKDGLWEKYNRSAHLMRKKFNANERSSQTLKNTLSLRFEAWARDIPSPSITELILDPQKRKTLLEDILAFERKKINQKIDSVDAPHQMRLSAEMRKVQNFYEQEISQLQVRQNHLLASHNTAKGSVYKRADVAFDIWIGRVAQRHQNEQAQKIESANQIEHFTQDDINEALCMDKFFYEALCALNDRYCYEEIMEEINYRWLIDKYHDDLNIEEFISLLAEDLSLVALVNHSYHSPTA